MTQNYRRPAEFAAFWRIILNCMYQSILRQESPQESCRKGPC